MLGATKFSAELLESLYANNFKVEAIFSIPEEFNISYSKEKVRNYNFFDFKPFAKSNNIPFYEVDSLPGKKITDYFPEISKIQPDVILVLGWYYMVPKKIRSLSVYGAWGIHASLLPNYAGGAPLVWAIIEGEKETGVTLFRLEGGVDDGDIIAQESFAIEKDETIKEVYAKATQASKKVLVETLKAMPDVKFIPQDKNAIKIFPQRKPEDGLIDWTWDNQKIKNFIRAQTKPYPGAFTIINGKKITIWDANIEDI